MYKVACRIQQASIRRAAVSGKNLKQYIAPRKPEPLPEWSKILNKVVVLKRNHYST